MHDLLVVFMGTMLCAEICVFMKFAAGMCVWLLVKRWLDAIEVRRLQGLEQHENRQKMTICEPSRTLQQRYAHTPALSTDPNPGQQLST